MTLTTITTLADDHDEFAWRLTSEQFDATVEKIEKINQRSARKGLSGTVGIAYRVVEETKENHLGFKVTKVFYETAITGDAPKYDDWRFIATLDFDEHAGLVVRTFPGVESVDREGLREGWCDHCKRTRARRSTYLVRNDKTGEQVQVGTSCIKDFTGWSGHVAWLDAEKVRDEVGEGFGGGGWDPDYSPETILAVAWACVKAFGYVRSGDWNDTPTSTLVRTALYPSPKSKEDREFAAQMRPLAKEAEGRAGEILAFILSDDFGGEGEYVRNLKAIAAGKLVSRRNIGLLASAPQAWARHVEQTLIRKRRDEKPSEWIGTAPDKDAGVKGSRITFTGVIETIRYIHGDYGVTTLYQLRAEDSGVIVKWFASNQALGDTQGKRVTIKGTVKAHDDYKGTKTTVLTRCSLLESDVVEAKPYVIDEPKKRTPRKTKAAPAPAPVQEAAPESVQEDPKPESRTESNRTPQVDQIGNGQQTKSESAPESNRNSATSDVDPLAWFAGGYMRVARRLADTVEGYKHYCRVAHERFQWVRLGDDPAERMTLADAWDLLGQAHAAGATWDAAAVTDPKVSAVQWDGFALVIGPDGPTATV
jgi:hypothetical protein